MIGNWTFVLVTVTVLVGRAPASASGGPRRPTAVLDRHAAGADRARPAVHAPRTCARSTGWSASTDRADERAASRCCWSTSVSVRFGGVPALSDVRLDGGGGLGHRPDRAERRRQDDAVQRDQRPPGADRPAGSCSTAATSAGSTRTSGPGSASAARSSASSSSPTSRCATTCGWPGRSAARGAGRSGRGRGEVARETERVLDLVGLRRRRRRRGRRRPDRHRRRGRARPGADDPPEAAAARRAGVGPDRGGDRGVRRPPAPAGAATTS